MSLVKKSRMSPRSRKAAGKAAPVANVATPASSKAKAPVAKAGRRAKAVERVAVATEQLAGGIQQSAAAAEELRRAMEVIASGAEEAASAAQEQSAAIKNMATSLRDAKDKADASRRRTHAIQATLTETSILISTSSRAIERNATRQLASVEIIAELERRAAQIGEITRTVSQISDQTSLLALNAAIEAARAGEHGRGFAIVAEEVRSLAGVSEKSATDVRELAESMRGEIQEIVASVKSAADLAASEARNAVGVVDALDAMRHDMVRLAEGSEDTLIRAEEAERASAEAQRAAEVIAAAAEEQSSATAQAQGAIQQQTVSLDQSQQAAQSLSAMTDGLRGNIGHSAIDQIGAAAEELSATVQELSGAAAEIMAAVDQISNGAQQQASAAQQASSAMVQIETSAGAAKRNADISLDRVVVMATSLKDNRVAVDGLVTGVTAAIRQTRESLAVIMRLEAACRKITKLVDGIGATSMQTTMLAVSGAVEAARAGDNGRGFAVVSNDIRALARDATENVATIRETVDAVVDQVASVRRDLETILDLAEQEVERSSATAAPMQQMEADIAFLVDAAEGIRSGADVILQASSQAVAGARMVSTAAEETGAATRQASTAAAEQAKGAEDLAAAIEEIASLAEDLKASNG